MFCVFFIHGEIRRSMTRASKSSMTPGATFREVSKSKFNFKKNNILQDQEMFLDCMLRTVLEPFVQPLSYPRPLEDDHGSKLLGPGRGGFEIPLHFPIRTQIFES